MCIASGTHVHVRFLAELQELRLDSTVTPHKATYGGCFPLYRGHSWPRAEKRHDAACLMCEEARYSMCRLHADHHSRRRSGMHQAQWTAMKETELWQRLQLHLGAGYFRVWASEYSLAALGQRTVVEALSDGVPCKIIWRAVWVALELPARDR
jgi:Protein of unknown function (DUF3046)